MLIHHYHQGSSNSFDSDIATIRVSLLDEVQFSLVCRPKVRCLSVLVVDGYVYVYVHVMMTDDVGKAILYCDCIHIAYGMYYKLALYDSLGFTKQVDLANVDLMLQSRQSLQSLHIFALHCCATIACICIAHVCFNLVFALYDPLCVMSAWLLLTIDRSSLVGQTCHWISHHRNKIIFFQPMKSIKSLTSRSSPSSPSPQSSLPCLIPR